MHSDLQLEHQYVFASSSFKLLEIRLIFLFHPHVLILALAHIDQFLEVVVLYLEELRCEECLNLLLVNRNIRTVG